MNQTPTPLAGPPKRGRRHSATEAAAQRRRRALQAFIDRLDITPADLARTLGLTNANAIYNFFAGRSASLSLPVIEAILDQFDDLTFEELTGRRMPSSHTAASRPALDPARMVAVTAMAAAGVWVDERADNTSGPGIVLALPAIAAPLGVGGFAVRVGTPGAEAAYPAGSILACRPLGSGEPLALGSRVIVRRKRASLAEITVREVAIQHGVTWLLTLSTKAEHQEALRVPPSRTGAPRHDGPGFRVEGIVTWAWIPQPGTLVPAD